MSETPDGTATTISKTFSRETRVSTTIDSPQSTIWRLLTDAKGYPAWNSTVVSVEGEIAPGSKIKLVSTLDPSRTFSLKVKEFQAPIKLAWGDALGTRTYSITETNDGRSIFEMAEKIGGPIFPLFASKIPSFDASFTQFAADLKAAAEKEKE
ncbi:polyketide cyclase/dehydrase [Arthrobacter sp. MYb23]|uniref:SRPBCC domain-containing protein n=1 Tax=unclassified Arthrobacter TaxID=235627 RepID=UPI000CFDDF4D|nr:MULTISPECIES: SRPBCC domain-containing protein [unclassified Arthrobacter]PRB44997.1 polyketide cyclase/dehydrase [Arthrobacter sp. MYb51]PRB99540.1 polyketide cyclase/dehydrase [Arthrobacter sp. MYb23]